MKVYRNQSDRNDESTFRGEPAIMFFNRETKQIAIFNKETKVFRTASKLGRLGADIYLETGILGSN